MSADSRINKLNSWQSNATNCQSNKKEEKLKVGSSSAVVHSSMGLVAVLWWCDEASFTLIGLTVLPITRQRLWWWWVSIAGRGTEGTGLIELIIKTEEVKVSKLGELVRPSGGNQTTGEKRQKRARNRGEKGKREMIKRAVWKKK